MKYNNLRCCLVEEQEVIAVLSGIFLKILGRACSKKKSNELVSNGANAIFLVGNLYICANAIFLVGN